MDLNNLWPLFKGAIEFDDATDDDNDVDDGSVLLLLLLEPRLIEEECVGDANKLLDIPD